MSISTFVAKRYLDAGRGNSYLSWISLLSILGIAIGIATMVVVMSVFNGFETELRNRFLAANAHVLAYRFPGGIAKYDKWEKTFSRDFNAEIKGISPFVHQETMARKEAIMHSILIKGISPTKRNAVQDVTGIIRPISALKTIQEEIDQAAKGKKLSQPPAIIAGIGLLSLMEAKIGDIIELVSPSPQDIYGQFRKFRVVGIYDSGLQHYDNRIGIMSIPAAQHLFNLKNIVTGLEIGLKYPEHSAEIADRMLDKYNLSIKQWQSYNRNIFEAMEIERVVIGLIVWLVGLVAGFNILTTLFISVIQKQRDISILKALGANNQQIIVTFLKQSIFMGIIGTILGVILAYGISNALERYQFIQIPEVYLLANLPVDYDWRVYAAVSLGSLFICAFAGLYPAMTAAKVSPIEGFTGTGE